MNATSELKEASTHPLPPAVLALLEDTRARIAAHPRYGRAEVLSGIHNPFGLAGALVDAWGLLEICQSAAVLDGVAAAIGPDIVLWDSELIVEPPGRRPAPHRDPAVWPIEPLSGVAARIALSGRLAYLDDDGRRHDVDAAPGTLIVHDGRLHLAAPGGDGARQHAEYVIRYMPASSRFVREADFPANRRAARACPLINFARRPIWLVRGADRAGNDFVTGFTTTVGQWSRAAW